MAEAPARLPPLGLRHPQPCPSHGWWKAEPGGTLPGRQRLQGLRMAWGARVPCPGMGTLLGAAPALPSEPLLVWGWHWSPLGHPWACQGPWMKGRGQGAAPPPPPSWPWPRSSRQSGGKEEKPLATETCGSRANLWSQGRALQQGGSSVGPQSWWFGGWRVPSRARRRRTELCRWGAELRHRTTAPTRHRGSKTLAKHSHFWL